MAGHESHYILPRPSFDKPVKLLIVVAPYYKDIADNMVAGAKAEIEAAGGTWDLVEVPGAL
ncbi:MAG: 6,7-dimethyl-8-ribityllumazine synthase, partial [Phaeobacter gallaeciensis]